MRVVRLVAVVVVALVTMLAAVPASAADDGNMLKNPSFEGSNQPDGRPNYWWVSEPSIFIRSGTPYYTGGAYSGFHDNEDYQGSYRVWQGVDGIVAGQRYDMSATFHFYGDNKTSMRVTLRVDWFDANGTLLKQNISARFDDNTPTNGWRVVDRTHRAPVGAVKAIITVRTWSRTGEPQYHCKPYRMDMFYFGPERL